MAEPDTEPLKSPVAEEISEENSAEASSEDFSGEIEVEYIPNQFQYEDEQSISSNRPQKKRRYIIIFAIFLMLFIATILCSTLLRRNRRKERGEQSITTLEDFQENNQNQGDEDNEEDIYEPDPELLNTNEYEILSSVVDDPSKLLNPNTPQGMAFREMLDDNEKQSSFRLVQRFALTTLFLSTNENNNEWKFDDGWQRRSRHECLWYGVATCRNTPDNELAVSNFDLAHNNLSGELPSEICLLSHLEKLSIPFNQFSGPIPSCLVKKLPNLEEIELQGNRFSGLIQERQQQQQDYNNNNNNVKKDVDDVVVIQDLSALCNKPSRPRVVIDCELSCSCCEMEC